MSFPQRILLAGLLFTLLAQPTPVLATRKLDLLESESIANLVLIGTRLRKSDGQWLACFVHGDNKLAVAPVGSYVGQDDGRIESISATGIELLELVSINRGEWIEARLFWPIASDDSGLPIQETDPARREPSARETTRLLEECDSRVAAWSPPKGDPPPEG